MVDGRVFPQENFADGIGEVGFALQSDMAFDEACLGVGIGVVAIGRVPAKRLVVQHARTDLEHEVLVACGRGRAAAGRAV